MKLEEHDIKRYRVLEWLNFIATDIHKGFSPLFSEAIPQEIKTAIFIPTLLKKFDFVNKNLQQKKFLLGDEFTLPDAYLYVMLFWTGNKKIDLSQYTDLTRYFAELTKRKSIQQSLLQEALQVAPVPS